MTPTPRILIVDDNPAIHEDFRKILVGTQARNAALENVESILFGDDPGPSLATHFDVDFALQGKEALEKVCAALEAGNPYALAFVDVRMPPGWDGIVTIEHVWKADPLLQIVVCTAYSDYSWEKMSARLGVNDNLVILKKPFDNIEVLQLAHALTKKWVVTQQARLRLETLDQMVAQRTSALELANAELRRSEERFGTAFRSSPIALAIQTLDDSRFVDANGAFTEMTGFSREESIGRTPVEMMFTMDFKECGPAMMSLRNSEAQISTRDGELRDVLVSTERISLAGEPHLLVMLQDVSERLSLEAQLRQSQKMEAIGQLAAGVAHDFNNLLTIIEGHASLQLSTDLLTPDVRESFAQIEIAAERAADLTRQLLAFSRRQIIRPRVLDLNELIMDLTSMLGRVLGEKVELNCELDENLPLICADPTSVGQVIMNLTLNARDAMPKGGVITLFTNVEEVSPEKSVAGEKLPGQYVCLGVSDTGVGMDDATRAHIFEPFFTTKEVNKGTGMGLATVYGILRQHHGWIDVVTAPNRGSTFRAHFPITGKIMEAEPVTVASLPGSGQEHTIFVVEDDDSVRGLVKEILTHHEYRVIEAASGDAALGLWPQIRDEVDLLLTDMVMPGEHNGLDLAQKLLADRPELKVIYSSGYSSELFASNMDLQEGRNYLPKPYLTSKLIAIIRTALEAEVAAV